MATTQLPRTGAPLRRTRSWWPGAIGLAGAASMIFVVLLWARGTGVADLSGGRTALTSLGQLTGLVSADLLLIQVLLMARVPWIERAYGSDRIARWHRLTGFWSLHLMLAHIVLITLGYAVTDRMPVLAEAWTLITTYPGMLLATAGTVALAMVAVTSVRRARRRLRYESWHLLHLYAYLGVGLALPHQLWTGADFTGSPAATVFWWTAWAGAAGAVLVFRLGLPGWRNLLHRLEVVMVVPEAPGVHSVYLRGRHLHRLRARPGQFFRWRFLAGRGWSRAHPYSLSAAPRPDMLRITVKNVGDGSAAIARLRPGTRVLVEGPYGHLTAERRTARRATMIASGIGVAPLLALLEEPSFPAANAVVLLRARSEADLVLRRDLEHLAASRGVRVRYLIGPRAREGSWLPAGWRHDAVGLRHLVPDIAEHDVFICGPEPWMDAVVRAARTAQVPSERLHLERFAW